MKKNINKQLALYLEEQRKLGPQSYKYNMQLMQETAQ